MWHFDIDDYLVKIVPVNLGTKLLSNLPSSISWFLGYRSSDYEHNTLKGRIQQKIPDYFVWFWIFVGAFAAISSVIGIFTSNTAFTKHNAPRIIGIYGADAILMFNLIDTAAAQPRSVFLGNIQSSIIGVAVTKLFLLSEGGSNNLWAASALATAISSVTMTITKSIHPPGGSSALIAASDPNIRALGWWYIPIQLVSTSVFFGIALIINNIQRRYPIYWLFQGPSQVTALRVTESEVPKDSMDTCGFSQDNAASENKESETDMIQQTQEVQDQLQDQEQYQEKDQDQDQQEQDQDQQEQDQQQEKQDQNQNQDQKQDQTTKLDKITENKMQDKFTSTSNLNIKDSDATLSRLSFTAPNLRSKRSSLARTVTETFLPKKFSNSKNSLNEDSKTSINNNWCTRILSAPQPLFDVEAQGRELLPSESAVLASTNTLSSKNGKTKFTNKKDLKIVITAKNVYIPADIAVTPADLEVLYRLARRIAGISIPAD